jgi:hypothetical protein
MITDVQYALSWRKEATGRLVNFATPGTEVRPEARFIFGGQPPQTFVVKRTYENIIRWIISRLSPGSGKPLETFWRSATAQACTSPRRPGRPPAI